MQAPITHADEVANDPATPVPFEPRRFRSTVPCYAAHRLPYPEALIRLVAERCGIARDSPVLDLGCGSGQLAIGFGRLGCRVTAMDPEPEMLAAAAERATAERVTIKLVEGSSYDLGKRDGTFRLATIGRSFHWMERYATLRILNQVIEPTGAVALFSDRRVATLGADWPSLLNKLAMDFAPTRIAQRTRDDPAWEPHEAILLRSPFPDLTLHGVIVARSLSVDDIVGLAYSMSSTSLTSLGDRRKAFEQSLRAGLNELSQKGMLSEIVEVRALIARRCRAW